MIDLEALVLAACAALGGAAAGQSAYSTVLVEPVEYRAQAGAKDELSEDDRRRLADYYFLQLKRELAGPFTVVSQPVQGTPTIRVKAAIVRENGEIRSELKAVDLASGSVLAEATEAKKTKRGLPGRLEKFEDARAACRDWARRAAQKLEALKR